MIAEISLVKLVIVKFDRFFLFLQVRDINRNDGDGDDDGEVRPHSHIYAF